jgi:hypothetical protein
LWEIYSYGRAPYPKLTQKEVVEKVAMGYRMEQPEGCPKDLYEKVILWCWELDAFKRPTFKVCNFPPVINHRLLTPQLTSFLPSP